MTEKYPDQTRSLNPTPEARVAMIAWSDEYAAQRGGTMDFWDKLDLTRRRRCAMIVEEMKKLFAPPEGAA